MKTTKLLGAVAALALLAACGSKTETAATGAGTATTAGSTIRPGSQEDLISKAGSDRVFFDFDSSSVRADQRAVLQGQAGWFAANPAVTAQIEGHADERGTREYNLALGQRRANASRDVLAANGVAGARLSTISYGKDRPIALGSDEEAWAQNRVAVTAVR